MMHLHRYPSKDALFEALASDWMAIIEGGHAGQTFSFALTGGTTPAPIYRNMAAKLHGSKQPARIKLVAIDERWVPDQDPQSNEGMITSCFRLDEQQSDACRLVSLKTGQPSPDLALDAIARKLETEFPEPFSMVLLGMGTDGHIASLFPGAGTLDEDGGLPCLAAQHPVSGQPRISLSLRRLLDTRRAWVVITGDEKLKVLQDSARSADQLPIARFLRDAQCDVEVYWSPD
jgi:6-phosphogluconolactonase